MAKWLTTIGDVCNGDLPVCAIGIAAICGVLLLMILLERLIK